MTTRNICLIGFIIGCMLLVWYMTFYGSVLMKHLTEGFQTAVKPVNVYLIQGKINGVSPRFSRISMPDLSPFEVVNKYDVKLDDVDLNSIAESKSVKDQEDLYPIVTDLIEQSVDYPDLKTDMERTDLNHIYVWPSIADYDPYTSEGTHVHISSPVDGDGNLLPKFLPFLTSKNVFNDFVSKQDLVQDLVQDPVRVPSEYPVNLYIVQDNVFQDVQRSAIQIQADLKTGGFHVRNLRTFTVGIKNPANVKDTLRNIRSNTNPETYSSMLDLDDRSVQTALSEEGVYHFFVWPSYINVDKSPRSLISDKNGPNVSKKIHIGHHYLNSNNGVLSDAFTNTLSTIKGYLSPLSIPPAATEDIVTTPTTPTVPTTPTTPTTPGFSLPTDPISVSHTVHVTGIPSEIKHNVDVVNKTPVSDIADDYGLTSLSRNPSYFPSSLPTPEITTTNPNGKMNIASKFLGALLSGIAVQS